MFEISKIAVNNKDTIHFSLCFISFFKLMPQKILENYLWAFRQLFKKER